MIKVDVIKDSNVIKQVKVHGHAGYEVKGKDIVCAAVSSIVITSCNAILKLDDKAIELEQKEGLIKLDNVREDDVTNKLLINMIDMLKELETEYKKYVIVNIKIKGGALND